MFFSLPAGDSIFNSDLETLKDMAVTIHLDHIAQPRFCKTVPYALKGKIEKAYAVSRTGVIEPIIFFF